MKNINVVKLLAILSLPGVFIGCQSRYNGFYEELGRLDCNCASALERSMRHSQTPNRDTTLDAGYKLQFEEALTQFDSFKTLYWNESEAILDAYPEEERNRLYLKGYEPCNCDTCLFHNDPNIVEQKTKIRAI